MSANLKIGIIADDNDAQQKFEKLSTSIDYTSKTVTQLANQFAKLNEANVKLSFDKSVEGMEAMKLVQGQMTTTANQLMNAIERQKLSWGTNRDSVEALKKELSELEKVETLLIQKGVGSSMSRELEDLTKITDKYEEYKKELKEAIKLKEELAQKQLYADKVSDFRTDSMTSGANTTVKYKAEGLLGNTVNQLKMDYEAYYQQLLKVISVYGVESSEAQKVTDKLKGIDSEIKKLGVSTTSTTVRIKNLVKNFVSAQMIVWAIRKAFNTLTNTLKESATVASEAEETYNLFITTFETVATTAERTATRLASAMGMANSTAQKALGTFGDLAAGYGATDKAALEFGETATEVALDIISYKNITGDLDTTFQSIASGLAGNVENFRKLGYVMTQAEVKTKLQQKGLDKLTGSALQYAQIQARLEILQEKSAKAQGDMVKTLDSTENVTRRLSEAWLEYEENLGKSVNTVLTPLKKAWLSILEQINKANKAQENFLKNGEGGSVFDVENNVSDRNTLARLMKKEWGNAGTIGLVSEKSYDTEIKKVIELMETFSTTPDVMKKMFVEGGYFIEDSATLNKIYESLQESYNETQKELTAILKAENAKNKKLEEMQSALSFMDDLASINGVSVNANPLSVRYAAAQGDSDQYMMGTMAGDLETAVNNMIKALEKEAPESFVSALDVALGKVDLSDELEAKLSSIESVFETLWNEFYSNSSYQDSEGKLLEQYQAMLDNLLSLAKDVNKQIEAINAETPKATLKIKEGSSVYQGLGLKQTYLSDAISAYKSYLSEYKEGEYSSGDYSYIVKLEEVLEKINSTLNGESTLKEAETIVRTVQNEISSLTKILDVNSLSSNPNDYITPLDKALGNDTTLDALNKKLDAFTDFYEFAEAYYKADGRISETEQNSLNDILSAIFGIRTDIENEENKGDTETSNWDSWLESFTGQFEMFTSGLKGFGLGLLDLLTQTDLFQNSLSFITDTILPVLNAFLEPLTDLLSLLSECIQTLLCDALEPFYKLLLSITEPISSLLTKLTDILSNLINMAMQPILSIIEAIIPVIVYTVGIIQSVLDVCEPLFEVIGWILNLLTPMVELVLKPIMNTIKWIFELLITGFTYVEVFFKKVIGNIGSAFMNVWNGIVGVLRSINIFGWKPFENMSYADTSKMEEWKGLDYQTEINKKLDALNSTVNKVYGAELTVAKNTEKDVDLSILNDLLKSGIITDYEYEALANSKLGLPTASATQTIKSQAGNYADYLHAGTKTSVSYGDISIDINGTDKSPEEIARAVARVLDEWQRNGRADWATA